MTTLVIGATGATGRLVVQELLDRDEQVKVIVRSPEKLSEDVKNHPNLSLIHASFLDLSDDDIANHVEGCDAVVSCLGHNMTFKGIFGPPHRLVTDSVRRICQAIQSNNSGKPVKIVLMNTAGNRNRDLNEPISFAERLIIGILRVILPPHTDNEQAADYLRTEVGQNDTTIEWVVVRPDNLIDEEHISDYELHPSPIRSAIFDAGITSRVNIGHFMAHLITMPDRWNKWKGQMPVIYNKP